MFVEILGLVIGEKHDPLFAVENRMQKVRQIGIVMQRGHGALTTEKHEDEFPGKALGDIGPKQVPFQLGSLPENIEGKETQIRRTNPHQVQIFAKRYLS